MARSSGDEELMTRFLAGNVTPDERDATERRFMDDPAFFEELCALEDEILLRRARGELPGALRQQVDDRLAASSARQERYDDVRKLAEAIASVRRARRKGPADSRTSRWTPAMRRGIWAAAAAALALAVYGTLMLPLDRRPPATVDAPPPRSSAVATATIFLQPGNPRTTTEPQANVFRIAPGSQTVRLELSLPQPQVGRPQATLATVDGPPVRTNLEMRVQGSAGGVTLSVEVPAERLPPGDYLLTVDAEDSTSARAPIASRFFSIVR